MMLTAIPPQTPLSNPINAPYQANSNLLLNTSTALCRATTSNASSSLQRSLPATNASSSSSSALLHHVSRTSSRGNDTTANDNNKRTDNESDRGEGDDMVASASAVAAIIQKVSTSPVEFVQSIEKAGSKGRGGGGRDGGGGGLVLPSVDFQRLCAEQLDLFRRIVHPDALLSVYVRPAGSYVMDRLELRRITLYPGGNVADIVILVGNFCISAGLRAAEAALSSRVAEVFPELRALVFPMVKHPFVVGFLVAELPQMVLGEEPWPSPEQSYFLAPGTSSELEVGRIKAKSTATFNFTIEQRLNAISISRSLAMAYVMDQKAMLLQQSSWQNNVRMSNLVEQIRGSLSTIRTLTKMLAVQLRRSEIAYDIAEDIMVQGDQMSDSLQQLQNAVYLTKENIIHYNGGGKLKKIHEPTHVSPDPKRSKKSNDLSDETSIGTVLESYEAFSLSSTSNDSEMPMPPIALAPLQQEGIRRPCNVSDVLTDLVGAVEPLAHKQQRIVKLCEAPLSRPLQVAVEEPALRQALSNLIEGALLRTQVGGKVEIVSTGAPAGCALVIIDDDGPDMHYMTQTHSLAPFGMDLCAEGKVEDNMTWNFIAGLTVAREILESYGCVVRVISPRNSNFASGSGGTRIELWLPFPNPPGTDVFHNVV